MNHTCHHWGAILAVILAGPLRTRPLVRAPREGRGQVFVGYLVMVNPAASTGSVHTTSAIPSWWDCDGNIKARASEPGIPSEAHRRAVRSSCHWGLGLGSSIASIRVPGRKSEDRYVNP